MLSNSPSFGIMPSKSFRKSTSQNPVHNDAMCPPQPAFLGGTEGHLISHNRQTAIISFPAVDMAPYRAVTRSGMESRGMGVEHVRATTHERVDYSFRSSLHLLAAYQQGVRRDGGSWVEGGPRSTLRDVAKKLTFVPAGHQYREWHDPRTPIAVTNFYFDPAVLQINSSESPPDMCLAPRLFFEDTAIWSTAAKLKQAIDVPGSTNGLYVEALGVVLMHELLRLSRGTARAETTVRGGLASWQQRIVTAYIEEHLSEQIPVATLAGLARLSTFHFCRAFRQSFGIPPHRYHTNRRIEQAKVMLAERKHSVTEIGLIVGFSEASSFRAMFRKIIGQTPSRYHRALR
jgi:AraC family transcriptional regulator